MSENNLHNTSQKKGNLQIFVSDLTDNLLKLEEMFLHEKQSLEKVELPSLL